jgi:hypothetical protein
MRPVIYAAAAFAVAQASPALADKYYAVTPSGAAEMLFPDKPQGAIGKLSSKCIDVKWVVTSSTSNELICEAPLNFGQSMLGQMLMGNSYSTPPRRFFRFNVAEIQGISRVQASGWMELQMAFGQTKRTDFSGPQFQNGVMSFMYAAGGRYPVGTSFPNHAILGVQVDEVRNGNFVYARVKEIEPNSAASKAGIQLGDTIIRIAGKPFKTLDDYLDATAKAAGNPTYEVELSRNGKTMKVTAERAFRATWSDIVSPAVVEAAAPASTGAHLSVADEILKLQKLKETGILTDAEFEAQKKKLLGE